MRISDWSSDVCSSDLHPVDSEGAVIPPAFLDIGEQRDGDKPPAMVMRPDILVAAVEDMEEEGQKRRFGHGDAGEILAAVVAGECPGLPESPVAVFAHGVNSSVCLVAGKLISRRIASASSGAGRRPSRIVMRGSPAWQRRSEEHTSELQSLMRISYAV